MNVLEDHAKQIDELLNLPDQMWLLGAGISKNAGIPLMVTLTNRVATIIPGEFKNAYKELREQLPEKSHVEHILSHLADIIALVERSRNDNYEIGKETLSREQLRKLHHEIQIAIRNTTRWGYFAPEGEKREIVGQEGMSVVKINDHVEFIRSLFYTRRAGLERRPAVEFFTTNYDTLLEDALALCRIKYADGFSGGAMAFWETSDTFHDAFNDIPGVNARVIKLHGSVDWYSSEEDLVVRLRDGATYPEEREGNLLIYPQATKYRVTQKDPFASLFGQFRRSLNSETQKLFVICGYSFGDDHINEEIESALKRRANNLTLLIFAKQNPVELEKDNQGLPEIIYKWLKNTDNNWRQKILIAGSNGVYRGSMKNECPPDSGKEFPWWTFQGLTNFVKKGPGV